MFGKSHLLHLFRSNVRIYRLQLFGARKFCAKPAASFTADQLKVVKCNENERKPKPDPSTLLFGKAFTDHMLEIEWHSESGWKAPKICPLHTFNLHPASKVFHYAQELFEGMKAYRGYDGKIRLFRPELNMNRMLASAIRCSLPEFNKSELLTCLSKLVEIDSDWVPSTGQASLYIRPTFIGIEPSLGVATSNHCVLFVILSPVGSYFKSGFQAVSLIADPKYVRAWPGGCGDKKLGSNYAPTIAIQRESELKGYQQVLWLFGADHQLTEVGTMNIFLYMINEEGEKELITPPLDDGIILPGITRISLLEMAREWGEFKVSERRINMAEVRKAIKEERLLEMFGSGTACVVCPVSLIRYEGEDLHIPNVDHDKSITMRFLHELTDIQYGKTEHPWTSIVC